MDKNSIAQMEQNKQAIINSKAKITSEQNQRNHILHLAKKQGCEREVMQIFERYDKLLNNCPNQEERKHIAVMGIAEVHKLLNAQGALNINGIEVLPAKGQVQEIIT